MPLGVVLWCRYLARVQLTVPSWNRQGLGLALPFDLVSYQTR